MTAKQIRRARLLKWRFEQYADVSAKDLAASLSCEALEYHEVPSWLYVALVEFRHLRTDARIAACAAFLRDWACGMVKNMKPHIKRLEDARIAFQDASVRLYKNQIDIEAWRAAWAELEAAGADAKLPYPPGMQAESQRLHREYNRLVDEQMKGARNAREVIKLTDECNEKGIILVPGGENL